MVSYFCVWMLMNFFIFQALGNEIIRINQMGYLPERLKTVVFLSDQGVTLKKFKLVYILFGKTVYEGIPRRTDGGKWGQKSLYRLDFSSVVQPGGYHMEASTAISPSFEVSSGIYKGTADFILQNMRQQRCGYNPFLQDSFHTADGIVLEHPDKKGKWIDESGGWHDASVYLQYTLTSANAVCQMLFAWHENPGAYKDKSLANGLPGQNEIPDILDEARWN